MLHYFKNEKIHYSDPDPPMGFNIITWVQINLLYLLKRTKKEIFYLQAYSTQAKSLYSRSSMGPYLRKICNFTLGDEDKSRKYTNPLRSKMDLDVRSLSQSPSPITMKKVNSTKDFYIYDSTLSCEAFKQHAQVQKMEKYWANTKKRLKAYSEWLKNSH